MKQRVTLCDIAKRAGVHHTTVSMALRNHSRLPAATRERLRALAEEMGYRPDPVLHALVEYRAQLKKPQQTVTLAYVTNWDSRWGWKLARAHSDYFAGAERRATELGYRLEHFWLGEPGLTHHRLSEVLNSRGIAGIVFASQPHETDTPLLFDWSKFIAVKIGSLPRRPALHSVRNNIPEAVRNAMQRITSADYSRIGMVMHAHWDSHVDFAWTTGFLAEQRQLPAEERIPAFVFGDSASSETFGSPNPLAPAKEFAAWLEYHRPDALIGARSFVEPHLCTLGMSIPRDIAFVDIDLETTDDKMAGLRQNSRRVGEVAVEILTLQMQQHALGLPGIPTATLVECTWIDGASLPLRKPGISLVPASAGPL